MKYIASFSGGKDSMATIILAHEHNEPLDMIIFAEVMFDEETSGELPEHIGFIREKCIPLFKSWGYEVKILHADTTYIDHFYHIVTKSKIPERNGKKQGFPMAGRCKINDKCKVQPIRDFIKQFDQKEITQYIGIAADEPKRLARLDGITKISPLAAIGWTEADCWKWCEENDLLSPIYTTATRGGCWFCHNQSVEQLRLLRKNYPDLWALLLKWDLDSPVTFHSDGRTVHDFDRRFQMEDEGKIPTDRTFRWKMVDNPDGREETG